ncbi:NYN domain-containing protein [Nocardia sp. NPDC005978]|uniref:NYN domain-containing protein n=1 Tax=Nocardia sp. NPDC005978 TaxID=3156725 RepID=UPI0033B519FC
MTNGPALIVVDAANVVGSRPDGWWRDRAGAARRLLTRIAAYAPHEPAAITVVLEGAAKAAADSAFPGQEFPGMDIVTASGSGDDAIVAAVAAARAADAHRSITVVTADRGLRERVAELGARTVGPGWLRERIDPGAPDKDTRPAS